MMNNIQNTTGRNDTIIPESLSGPSISVISKVDNIRRRLQRVEEMVAAIRLVNQAKTEEQKYIEKMKVFEVVERKEASGSKVIRTRIRERQRNQTFGLDGLHRSSNGRP